MTSRNHLKTFTERKCSKPWQEIKSRRLVHGGPVKLQGKNADLAVPTTGKNLRQPWELSPWAGEGALGTHAGPPLDLLHGLDHAGKHSRSPSLLGTAVLDFSGAAHMQHCNFCLKRLRLQISLMAWKSLKGCLHKPDVSQHWFPWIYKFHFSILESLIGFYVTHVCAISIRIINFMSGITVTRLREITSRSRKTLTSPDPFTEVMHPKQLKERKISLFTILTFPACWHFSHVATKVKSSSLMPHSLPSSNEGERGDWEIPNMLIFIKIHELN